MFEIDWPVQSSGRPNLLHFILNTDRRRKALLVGVASAALLAGISDAIAADLSNTAPYVNSTVFSGDVLSNTSTIDNDTASGYWTGNIVTNDGTITNHVAATWNGGILANADASYIVNDGTWLNGTITSNNGNINNNAGGHWTGAILGNNGRIVNATGATWIGDVIEDTGFVRNFGTWTGDIKATNDGFATNSGVDALWTGDVITNNSQVVNEDGATWKGDVLGNTNAMFNKTNALWIGDVVGNDGQINNRSTWLGDVTANAGTIYNEQNAHWIGDVHDNTGNIGNGFFSPAEWSGDVLKNHGTILNNVSTTWTGDVISNTGSIANYGAWNGNLNTSGRIINTGVWTGNVINNGTFFWAENQIIGSFDNRGALQLTGDLSGITSLTNSGTLDLTHNSAMQTLSVASAVFTPGSSYLLDVDNTGANDKIVVTGTARLGGTVSVLAATGGGSYVSPTDYTILTAGSVEGTFSQVTTDLAFFAPHLSYDDRSVTLTLKRNDVGLPDIGTTANQRSVGATVEALGAGNPLYDAALWLTAGQAQEAFNELSGQAHLTNETMALETSNLVSDLALDRLNQIVGTGGDGGRQVASLVAGPAMYVSPAASKANVWTKAYGAVGRFDATADTASLTSSSGGVAFGLDRAFDDWYLGTMLHLGGSNTNVDTLGSVSSTDYGVGIYGGRAWGNTHLVLGALYTRRDIRSSRNVAFFGFTDRLSASYSANIMQASAEFSHRFDLDPVSLTPYGGLSYVYQSTDGFTERGGPAALSSSGNNVDATFTTLGLRVAKKFMVANNTPLTVSGSSSWNHAFADTPTATYELGGGPSFNQTGAPVARNMLGLSAGLSLEVSKATMIDVTYDGRFGDGAEIHALKGTLSFRF